MLLAMQRDMSLIRAIAREIAQNEDGWAPTPLHVEGYTSAQVEYHVLLMLDAGLIEGIDTSSLGEPPSGTAGRLTWEGHEFLDASSEPSRWERAKALIGKAGGATFPIWMKVLTELAVKSAFDDG